MTTICLTNSLEGVRSCTIPGEHLQGCLHTDDDQCRGCLPYMARDGMLVCENCWQRFVASLGVSVDLITHVRSVEKGPVSLDGVRSSTVTQPTYPASWMQADELWIELAALTMAYADDTGTVDPTWPAKTSIWDGFSNTATIDDVELAARDLIRWVTADAADYVKRTEGATAAIRYTRMVQTALAKYPLEEHAQKVEHLKCRQCKRFSVVDRPPLEAHEDRLLVCSNPGCGHTVDLALKDWDLRVYADILWQAMTAEQRAELQAGLPIEARRITATFVHVQAVEESAA